MNATTAPKTFAEAEAVLASVLPGYESRPQQQALALGVEGVLANGGLGLFEAGCGTGKSLGAMIPAILSGKRTVVATATIALMEQYANKDVPFLQENLGVDFTWSLLKGRSNYFCIAKATQVDRSLVPNLAAMEAEMAADPEHSGDREHFAAPVEKAEFSLVASTSAECPGRKECPFGNVCFAERAKAKAQDADLVVTNTALLLTDVKVRQNSGGFASMLGEYDALIVDEAHELEEQATSAFADEIRPTGIKKLVAEARNFIANQGGDFGVGEDVEGALDALWAILPDKGGRLTLTWIFDNADTIIALMESIESLRKAVADTEVRRDGEQAVARRAILARRAANYITTIGAIVGDGEDVSVRYVEVETFKGKITKRLVVAPISVAPILRENLWEVRPSVLVSATLSVGGNFSYITNRLGTQGAKTLNVGTPFDYNQQALLFLPGTNIPSPKVRDAWLDYASAATTELVRAAGGGALLLFTSRSAMNEAYSNMSPRFRDMGLTVLIQGEGSNKALAKTFAEDTHSVLFALKSFFTGVDFAGDACRLVVIDKLAFQVPTDPMVQARSEQIERQGKSSFTDLAVPAMTLTMVQGFGRLIRSKSDKGVVAILDSRLTATPWGRKIVGTLPNAPQTTSLDDVRAFYQEA